MKTAAIAAVLMTLVLLSAVPSPASASTLTVYTGMGCIGDTNTYNGCGSCFNLTKYGGYDFMYTGQALEIYSQYDCKSQYGPAIVKESFSSCGGIKFDRSIRLQCGGAGSYSCAEA